MFGIQKFGTDGGSETSTGDWYKLDAHDSFGYVPAGINFEASSQDESIQRMDGDSLLYAIHGISSATGTSDTVTVIASGDISAITVVDSGTVEALYDITVSGGDKTALTVIVGGTKYSVSADGKLTIALPAFGLMTRADKLKLDGINSSTYLTTAAASSTYLTQAAAATTYATKAEMREYVKQLVESDTGYVFINGNGSEVGLIPALKSLEDPNLQIINDGTAVGDSIELYNAGGGYDLSLDVTYNGNGVITVNDEGGGLIYDSSSKVISGNKTFRTSEEDTNLAVTVDLSSDGTYDSATKAFTIVFSGNALPPPTPR